MGFAYVDDCDLIQIGNNPIKVFASMQELINSWGSIMEATGGLIRADKKLVVSDKLCMEEGKMGSYRTYDRYRFDSN